MNLCGLLMKGKFTPRALFSLQRNSSLPHSVKTQLEPLLFFFFCVSLPLPASCQVCLFRSALLKRVCLYTRDV